MVKRIPAVRILVVDDSEINCEVAQYILEAEGAVVTVASDGQIAIDTLYAHPDSFDIVLMDIQMPGMDGYTATRIIREHPHWKSLPIIALTAGAFDSFKQAAYDAGMDDFITKPLNIEQLLATIQRFSKSQQTQTTQQLKVLQQTEQNAYNIVDKSATDPAIISPFDVEKGLMLWGDKSVYQKFLLKFADSYKNAGNEIAEFLKQNDIEAASRLTHKLKGVAGNLALITIEKTVCQLDVLLQTGIATIETAELLQKHVDEVCITISLWLTADTKLDLQEPLTTETGDVQELVLILEQLLCALDQDNPDKAEPFLLQLKGRIDYAQFKQLCVYLDDFAFRQAEETTRLLIDQLKTL
jgi:CheY-like chemotaxis protein/HPt (histidine-containing phosphotransfer) domain-containing protein